MNEILNNIKQQIKELVINPQTIKDLNAFFGAVNLCLKGDNTTLIKVYRESRDCKILLSNILSDCNNILTADCFKKLFIEYLEQFRDNNELLYDIVEILIDCRVCEINHNLKLLLFKKLFMSGVFCYTPLNGDEFKKDFDYFKIDLEIIVECIDCNSFGEISAELQTIITDLYCIDSTDSPIPYWSLKDYII